MKKLITPLAALAVLFSASTSSALSPEQEKKFVEQYKTAFESKDAATLESLLYSKDANPDALEFFKMMMTSDMGGKVSNIELRDLTAEESKKAVEVMDSPDGGKAKLPVTPVKKLVLKIEHKDANGTSSSTSESYVAEVDGKLMIPVPVTVK